MATVDIIGFDGIGKGILFNAFSDKGFILEAITDDKLDVEKIVDVINNEAVQFNIAQPEIITFSVNPDVFIANDVDVHFVNEKNGDNLPWQYSECNVLYANKKYYNKWEEKIKTGEREATPSLLNTTMKSDESEEVTKEESIISANNMGDELFMNAVKVAPYLILFNLSVIVEIFKEEYKLDSIEYMLEYIDRTDETYQADRSANRESKSLKLLEEKSAKTACEIIFEMSNSDLPTSLNSNSALSTIELLQDSNISLYWTDNNVPLHPHRCLVRLVINLQKPMKMEFVKKSIRSELESGKWKYIMIDKESNLEIIHSMSTNQHKKSGKLIVYLATLQPLTKFAKNDGGINTKSYTMLVELDMEQSYANMVCIFGLGMIK